MARPGCRRAGQDLVEIRGLKTNTNYCFATMCDWWQRCIEYVEYNMCMYDVSINRNVWMNIVHVCSCIYTYVYIYIDIDMFIFIYLYTYIDCSHWRVPRLPCTSKPVSAKFTTFRFSEWTWVWIIRSGVRNARSGIPHWWIYHDTCKKSLATSGYWNDKGFHTQKKCNDSTHNVLVMEFWVNCVIGVRSREKQEFDNQHPADSRNILYASNSNVIHD